MLLSRLPGGAPELFASIQGEGLSVGVPSVFVRLAECNLVCDWCFVPETPVLLGDFTWRPIGELRPGDRIIGIEQPTRGEPRRHVRLAAGEVTRISFRNAPTVEVNHALRCTPEHKFWLTGRDHKGKAGAAHGGWREVSRALGLRVLFTTSPVDPDPQEDYERGWLAGMADGDGCALNDERLLERAGVFAAHGHSVKRRGGAGLRALTRSRPLKASLLRGPLGSHPHTSKAIESVTPTHKLEGVVTLTTTLGSFVAAGYVVKNCDTKYTWDWAHHDKIANTTTMAEDAVVARIIELAGSHTRNIIFTGGEPMLQQAHLVHVARALRAKGFRIEIETNGTIEPIADLAGLVDQWNVSAKLQTSGNRKTARLRTGPMTWFAAAAGASFKFVVTQETDLEEIESIVRTFAIPRERVMVMPEGTSPEEIADKSRWLVPEAQARGFRFSTRLHVLLWGAERGR
jgi:7-carboxy-7-deazaguanine synthase